MITLAAGLAARLRALVRPAHRYRVRSRRMELRPGIDLEHALRLAGKLEDAEIIRKHKLRN